MNRIYRLVWNRALGTVQVASELACAARGGAQGTADTQPLRSHALPMACAAALGLTLSLIPTISSASCAPTVIPSVTGTAGTAGTDGTSAAPNGHAGGIGTNGGDATTVGSTFYCVDVGSQVAGGTGGAGGNGGDGMAATGRPSFGGNGGNGGAGAYGIRGTGAFQLGNYGSIAGGAGGNGGIGGEASLAGGDGAYSGNGGTGGAGGTAVGGTGFILNNFSTGVITGGAGGAGGRGGFRAGTFYGEAGPGGQGGAAINSHGASHISNSGSIVGGAGGASGTDYHGTERGGGGGAGVAGDGFMLDNTASITGGAGGAGGVAYLGGTSGSGGNGGDGILGSNLTVTNSGSISGGQAGAAGPAVAANGIKAGQPGVSGDAVHFTGGTSTLTLNSGSVLNGMVEIDGGSTATLYANAAGLDLNGGSLGSNALLVNGTANINVNTPTFAVSGNINGSGTLNIAGAGAITLGTVNVGGLNSSASTTLDDNVTTSGGGQTYNSPVTLGAAITASDTQGGSIRFSTINGPYDLIADTTGTIFFNSPVGASRALNSLTVNDASKITLDGNVSTVGNQSYGGPVTLGGAVTARASTGNVEFKSTVDGAFGLDVNAGGTTTFDQAVGGQTRLSSLVSEGSGNTVLAADVATSGGGQGFGNAVSITSDITLSDNQSGSINFDSTIDGAHDLTITTGGMTSFQGSIGATQALNNITVTSAGIPLYQSWNINGTATLNSSGGIDEMPGAALSANLLTGSSTDATHLDTSTNAIASIGPFSANGFTLVNSESVLVLSGSTLDGGAGGVSLATTAGNIYVYQAATVTGANINLSPTGFTDLFGTLSTSGTITSNNGLQVETGSAMLGNVANNGGITFVNSDSISMAGAISGNGDLTTLGSGSVDLQGINTYTGATTLNSGTLTLSGNGSIAASSSVLVGSSSTLDISGTHNGASITTLAGKGKVVLGNQTLTLTDAMDTYKGIMSGTGGFAVSGGAEVFTGANTYTGGTAINGGSLQLGSGGTAGSITGDVVDNGSLIFNRLDAISFGGNISGNGALVQQGVGTLTLTGANTYTGGTVISGGTLSVSGDSNLGASTGALALNGGTLQIDGHTFNSTIRAISVNALGSGLDIADAANTFTLNRAISGSGGLVLSGAGTLVLAGANTYGGATTIGSGSTLQLGDGGSIVHGITDNGTLVFNHSDALNAGNVISGSGSLIQQGSGSVTLSGDASAFTGTTTVANGSLFVGSSASNTTLGGQVVVNSGATLGGFGTISGNVNLQSGAIVTPGSSSGTLTVNGNLTAAQGSVLNETYGTPGANLHTFGSGSSLHVGGDLVLNGVTLNVNNFGNMGGGIYNVLTYGGNLSESNGGISLGSTPAGQTMSLQNLTASKEINLIDTTGLTLTMWNANGQASAAQMGGGSGTWSATSPMWTNSDGSVPNSAMQPQPGFAIFGGTPGTVTIDASAGTVSATGMQFFTSGYVLNGDALTLIAQSGSDPVTINVGDGTTASAGTMATINNVLTGSTGLVKTDYGTLILGGANTYSGNTIIQQGTLALAGNGSIANTNYVEVDSGASFDISNATQGISIPWVQGTGDVNLGGQTLVLTSPGRFDGVIEGSGGVTLVNGVTQFSGANTYSGITTIDAGAELDVLNSGNLANSTVDVLAGGSFSIAGTNSGAPIASLRGNGSVNVGGSAQTLTLGNANDTFSGVIGGYGALKLSGGTEILTGTNTYQGLTSIDSGTLALSGSGSIASSSGVAINRGATLDISGSNGVSITTLTGNGNVNLGAQTLTLTNANGGAFNGAIDGGGSLTLNGGSLTLSGSNTYTGTTTIGSGATLIDASAQALASTTAIHLNGGGLSLSNTNFTTSAPVVLGDDGGVLTVRGGNTLQLDGAVSGGAGGLTLVGIGGGTLILTNTNSNYQGGTLINNVLGGTTVVEVKATGALGSGDVTVGASSALDFIGRGSTIVSAGSSTINVDGTASISFGNSTSLGSSVINMAAGSSGTLGGADLGNAHLNNAGMVMVADATAGNAVLTNLGSVTAPSGSQIGDPFAYTGGALGFFGNSDMANATVVDNAGGAVFITGVPGDNATISIGSLSGGGNILLGSNDDANNNNIPLTLTLGALNRNDTISGIIDDTAFAGQSMNDGLTKVGTGTLTLTGVNNYSGVTTISNGSLQIGNGGTTGSVISDIVDNATLIFNRSDAVSYGGTISGNGAVVQQGSGTLTLDGNNNAFTGTTTVANGSLIVGSTVGNTAVLGGNVIVDNGATLGGLGTIGGDVNVQSGGIVTPGTAFGVLGVNGNFTAAQNSVLNESFGAPTANFHSYGNGTSVVVGGNLTLDGMTLNVTDAGGMGPGIYNVFTYIGTLSESNGGITLGSMPAGQTLQLQNLTASKQINLVDTSGLTLDVWNANGQATSSQMGGGSGTWSVTSQMWTDANGDIPNVAIQPQPGFAVFGGTAGTVMLDGSAGSVAAAGMQFDVGGYVLTGDTLNLIGNHGSAPVIRVGDGSSASANMTATINNVLTGSDGLVKSDLGTLVLAGNNTYSGGTTINGGTLQIGNGGTTGAIVGNVVDHGALVFDRSDAVSFGGVVSGSGSLSQIGAGHITLSNANTYTGSTSITAGTLALSGNGSIASSSGVSVAGGAGFDISGSTGGASIATLSGSGNVNLGSQTLTLTQANGHFSGAINGSGGLTLASGSETLAGANTYTGATTIASNATLILTSDLASSSVINHGTLDVSASTADVSMNNLGGDGTLLLGNHSLSLNHVNGSYTGVIAGNGGLVLSNGSETLTGINTYRGGTSINNSVLSVSSDANLGAASGAVSIDGGALAITGHAFGSTSRAITLGHAGGTLDITDTANRFAISQALSGSGALTKSGAGSLVLTGDNSYAGGTTISAGSLQIGDGGTTGSVSGPIVNNGALIFDRSDAVSFNGAISGRGSLTKEGAGTLTLSGMNSYAGVTTINAGTLIADSSSLSGAVTDNAALVFNQASQGTFNGAINGNGTITKTGAGLLILDGNSSSFSGATTVQNGTLEIGDATTPSAYLGGNVTVDSSGVLRGHGTIGGDVSNSGIVWAGGSIGTLTVRGNYVQAAHGVLEVEATPDGQASLVSVSGTANLAGSALVVADNGAWLPRTQYTILTAAGGVSGQFASASSNFVFLTPTLSYGSNAVNLTLQRNTIDFNAVAKTPNEFTVATSLNKLSDGNVIYDALLLSNADTARKAFNQMSGEIHASVRTAIMDDERSLRDAVTNHLLDWPLDNSQAGRMDNGAAVWAMATARGGSHQGDGNASTLDANGSGMLLGMDAPVGDVARIGGLIGTGNLSDSIGAWAASSAHLHTRHAGLYASVQAGSFRLMSGAFYGWQNVDTDRHISFPAAAGTAGSHYHANTVQAYVDGSYAFTLSHGTLAPFVGLAAQRLHTDAFGETGTPAALTSHAQGDTQTYGTLGLRGALQLNAQDTVQAHASLGWQHAWGDTRSTATLQLLSGSDAFTVQGVPVARNAMAIAAGLRIIATPKLSLDATYNGQFAARVNDQAAHLSLTYSF
ncbi:MAG: autotransporter-associated beta strand repeat-containing protein [Dyella sp.]|uniref:autotransporter-associated beta strand repeat-containing protein n=1 Tax=Dyella sp. TaxID=1869338 RepID=UPI003F8149DF